MFKTGPSVQTATPQPYKDLQESYGERILRLESIQREYNTTMRALRILVNRLGGKVEITQEEILDEHWDLNAWIDQPTGNIIITVEDL